MRIICLSRSVHSGAQAGSATAELLSFFALAIVQICAAVAHRTPWARILYKKPRAERGARFGSAPSRARLNSIGLGFRAEFVVVAICLFVDPAHLVGVKTKDRLVHLLDGKHALLGTLEHPQQVPEISVGLC